MNPRPSWRGVLVALIAIHIAIGLVRIPTKVIGDRAGEIARYHEVGPVRFHLDNEHLRGAEALAEVPATSPTDAIVLWGGTWKGALEFAPALLAPRLLVHRSNAQDGTTSLFGRPIAMRDSRRMVLVGRDDHVLLRLE